MLTLFEHNDFLIVIKPAEQDFHADSTTNELGFFNMVKQTHGLNELYPVHRLDKVTSGLMIMAKTKQAAQNFGKAFETHQIDKFYIAVAGNKPKKKQGAIIGDMKKARNSAWKLMRSNNNPAKTHFFSFAYQPGLRIYLLKPYTGRTHQLRVALKSLGTPILGDKLYGAQENDRTYLHAYGLHFNYQSEHFQFQYFPEQGQYFTNEYLSPEIKAELDSPWCKKWTS